MNLKRFYKSFILLIIIFFISISIGSTKELNFTKEENQWLNAHPTITAGIMNNWPPMDYTDEAGRPQGIGVDFIRLLNEKLQGRIHIISGPWHEIYEQAKNKKIDLLMDITEKLYRKEFFNFTKPYVNIPHVIIVRKGSIYHSNIESLNNKTLAAENNYGIVKHIKDNYPTIKVNEFESTSDALNAVSNGKADFYIGNRAVASYIITNELISNLEIQAKVKATSSKNSIGIRKDWPILVSIIEKTLSSIPETEKQDIFQKWGGYDKYESYQINLTESEKEWIKQNKVSIGFDEDYAPYSFKNESGKFSGISVDIFKEIAKRTGIRYEINPNSNWSELYKSAINGNVDTIATMVKTPERSKKFLFSSPYISLALFIVTRKENIDIKSTEDLSGKKIALIKNYSTTKYVLDNFPRIEPILKKNSTYALNAVSSGEADATIVSIGIAQHIISRSGIKNLKFASIFSQGDTQERFGTTNKLPILNSIINKGLNSIDEETRMKIFLKWSSIQAAQVEAILPRKVFPDLTPEEKKWLKEKKEIKFASDPLWPPVEFTDKNNNYKGISFDFLSLISNMLNIKITGVESKNWAESIELLNENKIDVLTGVSATPERAKTMNFSEPYIELKNVIFTTNKIQYISSLKDLNGKKVAVLRGSAIAELIRNNYPKIIRIEVDNALVGLDLLSTSQTHAYIDTLLTTTYLLQEYGYTNIKVSGDTPYIYKICFATLKDNQILNSILNKTLKNISKTQRNEVKNKWWAIRIEKGFDYSLFWKVLIPTLLLILFITFWVLKLKSEIRKRKLIEIELITARKKADKTNKSKSEFLANMSHEIRTPMNVILGHSQLLQQDATLSDSQKRSVNSINKSGEHLLELINDILDMSKIEAGKISLVPTTFNLHNLLHHISEMFNLKLSKKQLEFELFISENVPELIKADENRIRQILINLTNNAIKFTDSGKISIKADCKKSQIQISISDTGCGIEAQNLKNIFSVFEQAGSSKRQIEGTGLGLAISKNIAKLMKGDIKVESIPGQGSTFTFTFKFQTTDNESIIETRAYRIAKSLAPNQNVVKILIVDDKEENRDVISSFLSPIGFQLKEAENGRVALELTKSWKPDLILLDVVMPEMDGRKFTKILKSEDSIKNTNIIAISASALDSERDEILKLGIDAFLVKPVKINLLLEKIGSLLNLNYIYREDKEIPNNNEVFKINERDLVQVPSELRKGTSKNYFLQH